MKEEDCSGQARVETGAEDEVEKNLLPLYLNGVYCGFPSPADEYLEARIDIREYLVKNELSTFYVYAKGTSMTDAFIADGALLIVDRSLDYKSTSKFLCFYDNGFTVKFIRKRGGKIFLIPASPEHKAIEVKDGVPFQIWGTVTYSINSHYKW